MGRRPYSVELAPGQESEPDACPDCDELTGLGDVGYVYSMMRRNPLNEDESVLIAQCLIDKGAVERSFTPEDLDQILFSDDVDESFINNPQVQQCTADPLGIMPSGDAVIDVR